MIEDVRCYIGTGSVDALAEKVKVALPATLSFNFSPNEYTEFGMVVGIIDQKLTTNLNGMHPLAGGRGYLLVGILRAGCFLFGGNPGDNYLDCTYVAEKLGITETDAEGVALLLNEIMKKIWRY